MHDPRRGAPRDADVETHRPHPRDVRRDTTQTAPRGGRNAAPESMRRDAERDASPRRRAPAAHPLPPHAAQREGRPAPAADAGHEGQRLSKQLAEQGLASRREADEWIEAGWVRVDGRMAVLGQRVLPHQRIEIDPAAHQQQAQRVTVLLHKPLGYVSGQAEDGHEPAVVLVTQANHWQDDGSRIRFHPGHLRSLAPAGRLDIDSTGLLVLTQDGRIAKHLIGEDSQVEKEYLVRVEPIAEGSVKPDALALLQHGLWLDDQPLKPAKVSWQSEQQLRVVLREGRKRQIRRMCELVGYKVVALKRVRIGSIVLGALPPGQWRYLGPHEHF
jgi:23S rRNA pseudouridine2604 synthase